MSAAALLTSSVLTLEHTSSGWLVLLDGMSTADEFPSLAPAAREFAARREELASIRRSHALEMREGDGVVGWTYGTTWTLDIPTTCGHACECDDALAHALAEHEFTEALSSRRIADANLEATLSTWRA